MTRASILIAIGLCAAVAACRGERPDGVITEPTGMAAAPPRPSPSYPGATPGAATTTTALLPGMPGASVTNTPATMDRDIFVEADFEEEAEREIVPGNMDEELTRIEKELAEGATIEGGAQPGPTTPRPGAPR